METASTASLVKFEELSFLPRSQGGDTAWLAEISGTKDGTTLGTGFARLRKARLVWQLRYDEVLIVLEGVLRVHVGDEILTAGPHDSIWLPAGSAVTYEADDALVVYAIHPADWREHDP